MFEDPHMIYLIAKQRHEELLAELEKIQKFKSSSVIVGGKNRRLGNIILAIADLFIMTGVGLKRKFGSTPEETEGITSDGTEP